LKTLFSSKIQNDLTKPRVYFTCHPDDYSKYYEVISSDILKTHDCIIYCAENMGGEIDEQYKDSYLKEANLFVIPITRNALESPNQAIDFDFCYAKKENIPVLPIMVEPHLDKLYSNKFGDFHYLKRYDDDSSAIGYEAKLKKYLDVILVNTELAKRVKLAFDAYVFLSYRKKDRHYANKLMRMIHSYPEFRDIAIWYDEFLTPGENFRENIQSIIESSDLFALLVTPRVLEYVDGQPNFIMKNEYLPAVNAGKKILPVEMEKTNKEELCKEYKDIPDCISCFEDESLKEAIIDALSKIAFSKNNDEREHIFLIGIAYLEGIDVEINSSRALELITSAAKKNLPEAMEMLSLMYSEGKRVPLDLKEAIKWGNQLVQYNTEAFGEEDLRTIDSICLLVSLYGKAGEKVKAHKLAEKAYMLCCSAYGEENEKTLDVLGDYAYRCSRLNDYNKACELYKKAYLLRKKLLGIKNPNTIRSLNNLASTHNKLKNYAKANELFEQAYKLSCEVLGMEHYRTKRIQNKLNELKKKI